MSSFNHSVISVFSCSILLLLSFATSVFAHELRPAYLQLRQTGPDTYDVLWKVPARGDNMRLGLYVKFPEDCANLSEPAGIFAAGSFTERWRVKQTGGLSGETIRIAGLSATMTDVLVRLERLDGTTQVTRLTPSSPSFIVETAPQPLQVAATYLKLGIEHILTGIDHLLFVLALLIITRGGWKMVKTVTAFTVSHSVTLSAAALGYVHVPPAPVEVVIALSIVFVAAEILHGMHGREGLTARVPWVVAFTFGLLHGLGFAGGLSEAGLPEGHIPLALLFFSLGVETGHFLFIGAVLAVFAAVRRMRLPLPRWAPLVPAYGIGSIAMFWVIERLSAF
jgi:hydrogenase/urease accessory protein HupE